MSTVNKVIRDHKDQLVEMITDAALIREMGGETWDTDHRVTRHEEIYFEVDEAVSDVVLRFLP